MVVVDCADFDGSLPRAALQALWPRGRDGKLASRGDLHLVVVANKFDLLPEYVSPDRVLKWVRTRTRQGGLPEPTKVHLVSLLGAEATSCAAIWQGFSATALPLDGDAFGHAACSPPSCFKVSAHEGYGVKALLESLVELGSPKARLGPLQKRRGRLDAPVGPWVPSRRHRATSTWSGPRTPARAPSSIRSAARRGFRRP